MWRVWWPPHVLVVAVLMVAGEGQELNNCRLYPGAELEYDCILDNGDVLNIKALPNDYVKIDCQGATLNCGDVPHLNLSRNGTLKSMSVKQCALGEGDGEGDGGVLSCALGALGAGDVTTLSLWDLSSPLRADHVGGLRSLYALMMFDSGIETSIPMEVLSSLPSLRHYRLQGAHLARGVSQFPSLPLTYLELSLDHLTTLNPHSFTLLHNLTQLHLWGNDYQTINDDTFTGLWSLESLSVSSSTRSVSPGSLAHSPRLREITLTRVNLDTLHEGVFTSLLHLQKISMSNDIKLSIESRAFAALPSLLDLKLDMSTIHSLPADAFSGSSALSTLSLVDNKLEALPATLFRDQTALKLLNLKGNHIKALPDYLFERTKMLVDINLDGNDIEVLPSDILAGLSNLLTLNINNNRLKTISPDAFRGAPALQTLLLSNNMLSLQHDDNTTTTDNVFQYNNVVMLSPFSYTTDLLTLDLSRNRISLIFNDWTTTLVQLSHLDLTYNHFNSIEPDDTPFLSSNVVVDLRHNNITTINLSDHLTNNRSFASNTGVAKLDDNPLHCDCNLYGVVRRLHGYYSIQTEIQLDFGDATCVAPPHLVGTKIYSLKPEQLSCNVTTECVVGCHCDVRPATDTLELLCNSGNIDVPQPDTFGMKLVQLQLLNKPPSFHLLPNNVQVLKLNGLKMSELPAGRPPRSVQEIDLRNNTLTDVPVDLIQMNLKLHLSGNLFECDCAHSDQLALLIQHQHNIEDIHNVTCRGGVPVLSIDTKGLCARLIGAVVGGTLALVGVLVALAAVLLYRYSLEIRVWLFARGWCGCLLPEERLDRDKQYDAFVSFAHGDEQYVKEELLPTLDREYRVCVHYRDWVVGDMIPTQIARSVESSRRTIIVLSHKFLDSIWAKLEFRAAHMQALSDRRARVVVVLLQDVADHQQLDDELRAYLSTNTYVKWGDPWFWDKLRYVLPRSGAEQRVAEIRAERKTREALHKFHTYGLDVVLNEEGKLVNAAIK